MESVSGRITRTFWKTTLSRTTGSKPSAPAFHGTGASGSASRANHLPRRRIPRADSKAQVNTMIPGRVKNLGSLASQKIERLGHPKGAPDGAEISRRRGFWRSCPINQATWQCSVSSNGSPHCKDRNSPGSLPEKQTRFSVHATRSAYLRRRSCKGEI